MVLEKPPVVKEMLIKKCLWVGIFLLVGLGLMIYSILECVRYREIRDQGVTVRAVICDVKKDKDVDGETEYDVYVNYDYNGNNYTKLHLTSTKSKWMDRVGDVLKITINPDNPTEELDDLTDGLFFSMFFGVPLFGFGLRNFFAMRHRLTWVEMYGMRDSAIRNDLIDGVKSSAGWLWGAVLGAGYIAYGIYMADVDSAGAFMPVLGLAILGLAAFFAKMHFKELAYVKDKPYSIQKYIVASRRIERDSDGDPVYEVLLRQEKKLLDWQNLRKDQYDAIDVGTELTYIMFPYGVLQYRYDCENRSYWKL